MTWETAKTTIDKLFELDAEKYSTLIVEFIGGEPLMEIDLINEITEYIIIKLINSHHPWLKFFRISICSNGLLYDTPKVQNYFKKYHEWIALAITIDGNKALHDKCRLDL
jgi:sulfatase maturation enzyme AslB (radical SAM superfamily)